MLQEIKFELDAVAYWQTGHFPNIELTWLREDRPTMSLAAAFWTRTGLTVDQALSCHSERRSDIIDSLITTDAIIVALQLEIHTR